MRKDDRKLQTLSVVVDEYIKTGEPVSSKTVAGMLSVSSATVRNDMAALEDLGYLEQPHTSAGRVPTHAGYRIYIQHLMKPHPLTPEEKQTIDNMLHTSDFAATAVLENALEALSELTGCTAVNMFSSQQFSVITKVEVIPAGRRLYVLLIITSSGDVRNKVCRLEFDVTDAQLETFVKIVGEEICGHRADELQEDTIQQLAVALGSYMVSLSPLLYAMRDLSNEVSKSTVDLTGEAKLLAYPGVDSGEFANFLSTKDTLQQILTEAFDGVHVIFGKENDTFTITNSSLLMSKYRIGGREGSFGVIGPIRLNYARVISYMEYFAQSIAELIERTDEENV